MSAISVLSSTIDTLPSEKFQMNLEWKVEKYQGRIRLTRLLSIAAIPPTLQQKYPLLKPRAVQLALETLKTIPDVALYAETLSRLRVLGHHEEPDHNWLKETTDLVFERRKSALKLTPADMPSLIGKIDEARTDAIYQEHVSRGDLFAESGRIQTAFDYYASGLNMKNARMVAEKWLHILKMYISMNAFSSITEIADMDEILASCRLELEEAKHFIDALPAEIKKRKPTPSNKALQGEVKHTLQAVREAQSVRKLASALASLRRNRYDDAASSFVASADGYGPALEALVSWQDLTFYATLCCLSIRHSFEPAKALSNHPSFQPYLKQRLRLTDLLCFVQNGEVQNVVAFLNNLADHLTVDPYCCNQVIPISQLITDSSVLQCIRSITSERVYMKDLAEKSGVTLERLNRAVARYVDDKLVAADYDSARNIVSLSLSPEETVDEGAAED